MLPDYRYLMNAALLLWGSIFCLIAAFCLFLGKNYHKEKRKWMLCMQVSTAVLLGSDALAWLFRGDAGSVGYYMVRISNFLVFAMTDMILLFFQQYVCCYLFAEDEKKACKRVRAAEMICLAAVLLVMVSQFTDLYYYFDADNFYHRNSAYIISMILPLCCMIIDLSLLLQYRKRMSKDTLAALSSYIVLPVAAAVIQIVHYGISLINLSICCSMILMYIVATGEQNREWGRLVRNREEIAEKLQIASTLNRCIGELSADRDIDQAINNLLNVIDEYFQADRTYIFELDADRKFLTNTYEYVKDRVTVQKDNLQKVPVEVIAVWMESFRESKVYYMSDLEQEKGTPAYEMLMEQEVNRLLAVPLMKEGEIIGFMGVDNPRSHYDDATLLASIQFFIISSLERKKEKEYLKYLSYRDKLTGLYNRNRYIEVVEKYQGKKSQNTGAAYIDLNGLKLLNDRQGHEAGDRLIQNAAAVLAEFFPDAAYRIGGDEFVIFSCNIEREDFFGKINLLRQEMSKKEISVSTGAVWEEETENLEKLMKAADSYMYEEKEEYHRKNGNYRR